MFFLYKYKENCASRRAVRLTSGVMSSSDDDARTSAAAARFVPVTGDTSLTINL